MKYLGIDYGSKRVGVSLSDQDGKIAFPRGEIGNDVKLIPSLVTVIEKEKVGHVVVGDTLSSGGRENKVTEEARAFVGRLAQAIQVPIEYTSEMWSSVEASRYAPKGEEHNDAAAATIILQRYLDIRFGRTAIE